MTLHIQNTIDHTYKSYYTYASLHASCVYMLREPTQLSSGKSFLENTVTDDHQ